MLNIHDFVQKYNVIPNAVCDDIVSQIKNSTLWNEHSYVSTGKQQTSFPPTDFEILDSTTEQFNTLVPYVIDAVKQYEEWNQLYNTFEGYISNPGVASCSPIRFNRCKQHRLIERHHDHIKGLFGEQESGVPILSIVGLLNDDFKSGDFVLFDDYNAYLKKGDILIFPATFLYPHKVTAVSEGTRYSFASWAY